jgi:hypothetical protein
MDNLSNLPLVQLGGGVLDVVAVISNPARYQSRYRLYRDFERYVLASGARLTTVESALGERPFEVTSRSNPRHVQVRRTDELWDKENLINLGISRLPSDWKYVAWIDADVSFARPDWVLETLQQLQVYPIVQLFADAVDLGPEHQIVQEHKGFAYCYHQKLRRSDQYGVFWHPGFAWACTREAFDALGGLIDWAILGAADHHMAKGLIGEVLDSVHGGVSPSYKDRLVQWQNRAVAQLQGDLGYVSGLLMHHWHGKKQQRFYRERWSVLVDQQFDPLTDLVRDHQGLWRLAGNKPGLRDGIRDYFRSRNEDSIEI